MMDLMILVHHSRLNGCVVFGKHCVKAALKDIAKASQRLAEHMNEFDVALQQMRAKTRAVDVTPMCSRSVPREMQS